MTGDDAQADVTPLESLTLAQCCALLLRRPRRTLREIIRIARHSPEVAPVQVKDLLQTAPPPGASPQAGIDAAGLSLLLRLPALALLVWGNFVLASRPPHGSVDVPAPGALLLLAGLALWLLADLRHPWPHEVERQESDPVPPARRHTRRLRSALLAAFCSLLAWRFTAGNSFTLVGLVAWTASIALWCHALLPASPTLRDLWRRVSARWRRVSRGDALALILIVLLAAGMRLGQLDSVMPEMSSDHVEKIRDAWRVAQGERDVFFANIGGREPLQMYAMALLAQLPGQGFNFYTLKLLSALEGIVAVLLIALAARSLIGGREGRIAGWLAGGLVAVAYWHLVLSRMGLRIVLTTIVATLLLYWLNRALRHNRRADFLATGLVAGLGLYTYQAARMLPLVVAAALALAWLRCNADRRRALLRNAAALVLVALAAAVPLAGYALEHPQEFWRRTTSRVLGDQAALADDSLAVGEGPAGPGATLERLAENMRNALLMFNRRGDIAWINGAPGRPALDPWTGALFLAGLVAWARRIQRERSAAATLAPLALFIMLLPSALALSFPHENPSHTRASGALPAAMLVAALPLAQLVGLLRQQLRGRAGQVGAAALVLLLLAGAMGESHRRYFVENLGAWEQATFPYSTAGQVLAAFVAVSEAPGNAFVIAWPHWWDHRAVGIEAGLMEWPNAIPEGDQMPGFLAAALAREGPYRLNADRGLLFLLTTEDTESLDMLRRHFPDGQLQHRRHELARHEFLLYRVPAPGIDRLLQVAADEKR